MKSGLVKKCMRLGLVLVVAMLWLGGVTSWAQELNQPKVVSVTSKADVRNYCITNIFQAGAVKQVGSPAIPLKSGANPDLYMVLMNRLQDGSVTQFLLLTCDRKSRFTDYDQLIIKDGKTLPVKHINENELGGRKTRTYMVPISDASYVKWTEEGASFLFKGKSGELTVAIPGFVFAGVEEQFIAMIGSQSAKSTLLESASVPAAPVAVVPKAPVAPKAAMATPAGAAKPSNETVAPAVETAPSPFLRSGSIGKKPVVKTDADQPGRELQLPKLSGQDLVGQEFLFLPLSPTLQSKAYEVSVVGTLGAEQLKLPYEQHVGRTLFIKSFAAYEQYHATKYGEGKLKKSDAFMFRGGSVYEAVIKETGQQLDIVVGILGVRETWKYLALKRDLEFAQAKLMGKKYWLNTTTLYGYDAEKDRLNKFTVPRWGIVEVTDVALGTDANPVRLIFKYAGEQEYFLDVEVSPKTDTRVGEDFFGLSAVGVPLKNVLLTADPREKYKWPADVMDLVTRKQIRIGFTYEQVRLAWGEPMKITQATIGNIGTFHWTYDHALVSFAEGKCQSIVNDQ